MLSRPISSIGTGECVVVSKHPCARAASRLRPKRAGKVLVGTEWLDWCSGSALSRFPWLRWLGRYRLRYNVCGIMIGTRHVNKYSFRIASPMIHAAARGSGSAAARKAICKSRAI
jgi:hypothetical protein